MEKHREMLAMLLREAVYQNKLSEIPPSYIYGLCQFIVCSPPHCHSLLIL
jgi:hemerythrin-like domain-containing protein